MKTATEWLEIINQRGATTQPAGTLKLITDIQRDALTHAKEIQADARADLLNALERVEPVLTDVLKTYSAEGLNMFHVEFELNHIKSIRAAAMPN